MYGIAPNRETRSNEFTPFVEGVKMGEIYNIDELRAELNKHLQKQSETLKARVFGGLSDTELIEYDLREEIISDIQRRLARSTAA
jgi:asparagine synthetase B (glutamine-hydrolysing)